ncbi:thymidine phosphorylase [Aliiroseovarius subalbicans]|uniref:thymidine phosphorylase n=1 Tax=Aliiroseovarius subalbicans TaxID=2925840 RepID=UPI001F58F711|nr:thymidine phosphorylase [Aliiroseovarius subalbicans]MCI2399849.1 thymidine phosphorylase [Aliiroseovarius subalbicans]
MLFAEIIRKKRDAEPLSREDIGEMVAGITSGAASEGQVAAFAMAVLWRGMDHDEAAALTLAMRDSGDVFKWDDLPGPAVDKHSTGGVGDNVSLMLAPIVAACGGYVPMISGRGLGHTGGTLDKMDAIPGYATQPDNDLLRKVVAEVGCAIIGQTGDLAPADKRFYGIRDVTATVESVPLITASILSKKLAAGLGSLVMDVKCGNGAFMESFDRAEELAGAITGVARAAGLPCHALITDMNQPLASAAGNALEVVNAVEFLTGARRDARLQEVTLALCGEMLVTAGLQPDRAAGVTAARAALETGRAAEVFDRMVAALGGPSDFIETHQSHLTKAKLTRPVLAPSSGHVRAIATREVGLAVVELGGGRRRADDVVNPAVGLTGLLDLGVEVVKGGPLCMIHADDAAQADAAEAQVLAAYQIGEATDVPMPVLKIID